LPIAIRHRGIEREGIWKGKEKKYMEREENVLPQI